jgi:hypothetical protein
MFLLGLSIFSLSACGGKSSSISKETPGSSNGILDLKEEFETSETAVSSLEDVVETSSAGDEGESKEDNSVTESILETTQSETKSSVKDILNKLPDSNITGKTEYQFNAVTIRYISGLESLPVTEYQDSYLSEDETVYLLHNYEHDTKITDEDVYDKFDSSTYEDITDGTFASGHYIMAGYLDGDNSSYMAYVFVNNDIHLFVLAEENDEILETDDLERVKSDILDIITTATYMNMDESSLSSSSIFMKSNDIYWKSMGEEVQSTPVSLFGVKTEVGKDWEQMTNSDSYVLYKTADGTQMSLSCKAKTDSSVSDKELLNKYFTAVTNEFGTPDYENLVQLDDSDMEWYEFVYNRYVSNSGDVSVIFNISVYVGLTDKGVCYIEFSRVADDDLEYNTIHTVLDSISYSN